MIELALVKSFFFFNDTATTEIYTLSLHDALPISARPRPRRPRPASPRGDSAAAAPPARGGRSEEHTSELQSRETISYAVFCLKKKKKKNKKTIIKSNNKQNYR